MKKIVVIKEPSLLREGIINIIHSVIPNVTISAYGSLERQKIYEQENMGDLLFIDVDTDIDVLKVIKLYQNQHKKIIVWTTNKSVRGLLELFQKGLSGYFYVEMDTNEFISAILIVIEEKYYIHPALSSILLDDYIRRVKEKATKPNRLLTKREWEILELLTAGNNNEQIAQHLDISCSTVKNHVSSILKKLNASNRTNAVSIALKKGWLN